MSDYKADLGKSGSTPEPRADAGLETFDRLLDAALADLGLADKVQECRLLLAWEEVAGALAAHARPLRIRHSRLEVGVPSPVWRTQLNFVRKEIVERLNARAGRQVIKDLVLVNQR